MAKAAEKHADESIGDTPPSLFRHNQVRRGIFKRIRRMKELRAETIKNDFLVGVT